VGISKTYQHHFHAELKRVLSLNIFPILDTTFRRDHTSPSTMHGSVFFRSQRMTLVTHACTLLEHLYTTYRDNNNPSKTTAAVSSSTSTESIFMDTILSMTPNQQQALVTKLDDYFSGRFPCSDGNVLAWWKVMVLSSHNFKTLTSSNAETRCRFPNSVPCCSRYFSHYWR
jgi:hypothetical protein